MSNASEPQQPLSSEIREHSPEGIDILYSEPSSLFRWTILLVLGLVTAAVLWSLFARADVIVSAGGELRSEDEMRRVYSPVDAELETLLIREEEPLVQAGEAIARLRSSQAVAMRASAETARIELEKVELRVQQRPAQRELEQRRLELMRADLAAKEAQLHLQLTAGSETRLTEQRARLEAASSKLAAAEREEREARDLLERMRRAGRGLSQLQVDEQRAVYESARDAHQIAMEELGVLESQFISETEADRDQLEALRSEIGQLRIDLGTEALAIEQRDVQLDAEYAIARENARAAREVQFDITSDGSFILVLAPVSGVVTNITWSQAGDKVEASTPLVSIAPQGSRKVLEIEINESDRGLLVEGSTVRMKFNAFPYQQYGIIEGTLEYISPTTRPSATSPTPTYRGRVSLDRDFVEVDGNRRPLRYGMTAVAEIIVRQRRVIELLLDTMRRT